MKILALESSAVTASVCICEDEVLIGEFFINNKLTHSQTLLPMAEDLLKRCSMDIRDIDLFAVSKGPGSFTGLRIGIAAVKGMAMAVNKPCIGVSTLEAMAQNLIGYEGTICAVMDARCGQVYNANFSIQAGNITRLTPDRALTLDDLGDEIAKSNGKYFFVGDGAKMCYNRFIQKNLTDIYVAPEHLRYQRASGVARVVFSADEQETAASLTPTYLRMPQAERELILKNGGIKNDCYRK